MAQGARGPTTGTTLDKPLLIAALATAAAHTITQLRTFGIPLTPDQHEALETWFHHTEIFLLPLITYLVITRTIPTELRHPTPIPEGRHGRITNLGTGHRVPEPR